MEQFWFPLKNMDHCEHVPVDRIGFLEADGNYTRVHYMNEEGQLVNSLQSGWLKNFEGLLDHGFIRLRRDIIINRSYVRKHMSDRTVVLTTGHSFTVPKPKWSAFKAQLSMQLVIPFGKKGDSSNKKDDSSSK
jgi:DNA-binding LytR/AlgR family response regulator